jgi:hypothetical protein
MLSIFFELSSCSDGFSSFSPLFPFSSFTF